ncbi:MAG: extracellular solute-binding protein [Candidatus Promineifilaceae bacterium]|jgi:ABC-type glycerol-3-phosphate transport system substrate-binding protein
MRSTGAVILIFVGALILTACDLLSNSEQAEITPEPTATVDQTAVVTTVVPNIPDVTTPITPTQETSTLRVWLPPTIAERTEAGTSTLLEQISLFEQDNPQVTLIVERKRARGTGGILDYLRTGHVIAPDIMPDLVAVPTDLLPAMASENLIQPLDSRLDDEAIETLFPPALSLAQPESNLLGYPFALGSLPHLAYNNNVLTGTLPLTWERLIENDEHSYVFAADGTDGALLALQFYLEIGGNLVDETGQSTLELDPLIGALSYIENGQEQGLFAPQSSTISTTDQAWQIFLSGGGNIAQTTADNFLGQSVDALPIAYTIIPGIDRPLTPLVDGWAWAVTATDPIKQEQAISLIETLTTPENLASWSQASDILPSRRDALDSWQDQGLYVGFIGQELERAEPLTLSPSSTLITVLKDAVFQVVSGSKTAQQAAIDAVNGMKS